MSTNRDAETPANPLVRLGDDDLELVLRFVLASLGAYNPPVQANATRAGRNATGEVQRGLFHAKLAYLEVW